MVFQHPVHIDFSKPITNPDVRAAVDTQNRLRHQVRLEDDFGDLKTIAGVDVGYDLQRGLTKAVVVLLEWPSLELRTSVIAYAETDFPYISGLLAFREVPAILDALSCLPAQPGLLMVDGQGVSHPRRLGIAAHLGVLSGLPAIGVAKSRLCGKHQELSDEKFSQSPLTDKGEHIGTVLRSKDNCNPLFISAGHRITHQTALDITLRCLKTYRLPEPTRIADQISKWALSPLTQIQMAANNKKSELQPDVKNPPWLTGDLFGPKETEEF
jgi:deoxyribonuclease V